MAFGAARGTTGLSRSSGTQNYQEQAARKERTSARSYRT